MLLLSASKLSDNEKTIISSLRSSLYAKRGKCKENAEIYDLENHVRVLGLAVPEAFRVFEIPLGWPRLAVDAVEERQQVKRFVSKESPKAAEAVYEGWLANDMDSEAAISHRDALIHGRSFVSVSSNEEDPKHPLIRVESTENMVVRVDQRFRRIDAALRVYPSDDPNDRREWATLYLPDETIWMATGWTGSGWEVTDRDHHNLGRVPVVMHVNRRRTSKDVWDGVTEMLPVIPLADMASRVLMNLQFTAETLAIPKRYLLGGKLSDFMGLDGKQRTLLEAYIDAMLVHPDSNAKIGQLPAADTENFAKVIRVLAELVASVTGLPVRYLGQTSVNPASEGAIRADEVRLIRNAERANRERADSWGKMAALYERFRTRKWIGVNTVRPEFENPATPTQAERADAMQKLAGGIPLLSRQGVWDEMGWSEPRKDQERRYFAEEDTDQTLGLIRAKMNLEHSQPGPQPDDE